MILFPLSIVAGVVAARRWPLHRALLLGTALFALAVLAAWKVQGFAPSPRDLLWLAGVWVATTASAGWAARGRRRRSATTV